MALRNKSVSEDPTFYVADFATLSDERRSRSNIVLQFNTEKRTLLSKILGIFQTEVASCKMPSWQLLSQHFRLATIACLFFLNHCKLQLEVATCNMSSATCNGFLFPTLLDKLHRVISASIRSVILLWKGPPKLSIECHLVHL